MSGLRALQTLIAVPVTRPDVAYSRYCALRHGTSMLSDAALSLQVCDGGSDRSTSGANDSAANLQRHQHYE
jgi:hypothetical protein